MNERLFHFVLEVWEISASSPPLRETHPNPGQMPFSLISNLGIECAGVPAPSAFNNLNQPTRTLPAFPGPLPTLSVRKPANIARSGQTTPAT
jgi:hypothetical protein